MDATIKIIEKLQLANDAMDKGIDLQIPTNNIPITLIDIKFRVVDHGLHIASDIILSRSLIPILNRSCRYT